MHVLIPAVERHSPGCTERKKSANLRRTTLTRHQNHHVGTQPPPSGGFALTPYRGSTSTIPMPASVSSLPSGRPYPASYLSDPLGPSVQSLGIPPLPPPPGFAPQQSTFSSQMMGYSARPSAGRIGASATTRGGQNPMFGQLMPSTGHLPPFSTSANTGPQSTTSTSQFPRRAQRESSTIRQPVHDYSAAQPSYEIRRQMERREQLQQSQQPQQSLQLPFHITGMPPPLPSQQRHRRAVSQMELPEETEEERQRKRRRSGL
jgi:hypothetical protein